MIHVLLVLCQDYLSSRANQIVEMRMWIHHKCEYQSVGCELNGDFNALWSIKHISLSSSKFLIVLRCFKRNTQCVADRSWMPCCRINDRQAISLSENNYWHQQDSEITACCLMGPILYLNQCRLITRDMIFTCWQFHRECSRYLSFIWVDMANQSRNTLAGCNMTLSWSTIWQYNILYLT